jgi:hypothetical protein
MGPLEETLTSKIVSVALAVIGHCELIKLNPYPN